MIARVLSATLMFVCLATHSYVQAETVHALEQNWDGEKRRWFHHVNQGSRLIPYAVFLHLEISNGATRFATDEHLDRYGFLASPRSRNNPDGLPIGFARDGDYLGLTCAACHTTDLIYQRERIRIEGGAAQVDLQRFLSNLARALESTAKDAARFERFTQSIKAAQPMASPRALLDSALAMRRDEDARNRTDVAYGYGRLDAFGAILNKGLALTGVADNRNAPNAPTSYPFLWDTPQHDWVEWNGSSPNPLEGALSRNIGEVIGVYGHVEIERAKFLGLIDAGYPNSVRVANLRKVERQLANLQSPQWPDLILPSIDRELAARGEPLYQSYCAACHEPIDRADPKRMIKARMSSLDAIGTDPQMARNALAFRGRSGRFAGQPRFYFAGDALGEEAPALHIVNHVMVGVLRNHPLQTWLALRDARIMGHGSERHPPKYLDGQLMTIGTETSEQALLAYKARPLNGIWASAPYLHNGSVPTLHDLLKPSAARPREFTSGATHFDPEHVGIASAPCRDPFLFDTRLPGNSNAGHEYGTGQDGKPALSEDERRAIVEYLKSL